MNVRVRPLYRNPRIMDKVWLSAESFHFVYTKLYSKKKYAMFHWTSAVCPACDRLSTEMIDFAVRKFYSL